MSRWVCSQHAQALFFRVATHHHRPTLCSSDFLMTFEGGKLIHWIISLNVFNVHDAPGTSSRVAMLRHRCLICSVNVQVMLQGDCHFRNICPSIAFSALRSTNCIEIQTQIRRLCNKCVVLVSWCKHRSDKYATRVIFDRMMSMERKPYLIHPSLLLRTAPVAVTSSWYRLDNLLVPYFVSVFLAYIVSFFDQC